MQAFIYIREWLDSKVTPLYTWSMSKSMNYKFVFVAYYVVAMVPQGWSQKSPGGDS